ncbi:MAG TPA: membrane protein insertase YidC, partial [Arenibaculum sp.]|nr:membrane protein insertase YidC [Arenibaculum sp.]
MTDQRNLLLAIVLSIAILLGFQFLYEVPRMEQRQAEVAQQQAAEQAEVPQPQAGVQAPGVPMTREELIAATAERRVRIDTPRLHGSISSVGGRIDDLTLADYEVTVDPGSPEIVLLSPPGTSNPYYAEFGWVTEPGSDMPVPGPDTNWEIRGGPLTP